MKPNNHCSTLGSPSHDQEESRQSRVDGIPFVACQKGFSDTLDDLAKVRKKAMRRVFHKWALGLCYQISSDHAFLSGLLFPPKRVVAYSFIFGHFAYKNTCYRNKSQKKPTK